MKKLLAKIKAFIRKLLGKTAADIIIPISVVKKWDECTKSSNWTGRNAAKRIMNILSPNMSDAAFTERFNWAKARGVDHFNVFIANKADGEAAGYSIYGKSFNQNAIDKNSVKVMEKRIDKMLDAGFGVVLWMMADDSNAWAKSVNFEKYCKDVKDLGWFKKASAVVVGLEVDEYWNANQVNKYCQLLKKYSGLKVGVHQTSNRTDFVGFGDLAYLQVPPGTSQAAIANFIKKVKGSRPVCMFEMERQEDRARSQAALKAGAFSVGNW